MRLPKGSYLKLTVPPLAGSVTLVKRFSKCHAYVVTPAELLFVAALPFKS